MPPKKAGKADKSQQKARQKVAEDKTFGLKNKNKSSKVQKYVQQVQQAATQANTQPKRNQDSDTKKELERKKKEELAELFKPVSTAQKVPFGVDPKTILCQFFKVGACTKGKNCKFSHDLAVERKSNKIDLYTDKRLQETDGDTMENWDQEKLEAVVASKHGKGIPTSTDIAVEDKKYGWFWQCPNGSTCKYRHALPPGFVLKEQKKKSDDPVQTLEEWIEAQRSNLPAKLTPVTLESFAKWKLDKQEKAKKDEDERTKSREAAVKAGKSIGASGRELFTYNPEMFNTGDDDEAWEGDYTQREEEEEEVENGNANSGDAKGKAPAPIDESLFADEDLDALEDMNLSDAE